MLATQACIHVQVIAERSTLLARHASVMSKIVARSIVSDLKNLAEQVSAQSRVLATQAILYAQFVAEHAGATGYVGSQVDLLATFVKAYAKLLCKYLAARTLVRSTVTSDPGPLD